MPSQGLQNEMVASQIHSIRASSQGRNPYCTKIDSFLCSFVDNQKQRDDTQIRTEDW